MSTEVTDPDGGHPTWLGQLFADIRAIALPLLISGGGFFGFVALAGGAFTWARFSAANLPADQAVAAMPKDELIAVGAVPLTAYALLGLLAVIATYLIDKEGKPSKGMLQGLLALVLVESAAVLGIATDRTSFTASVEAAAVLIAIAALTVLVLERLAESEGDERFTLKSSGKVLCALLAVVLGVATGLITGQWWVGLTLPLAGLLAFTCLRVADIAQRFAWYGVAVFFSVALLGTIAETLRTLEEPQLQPVALIRKGDGATEGLQGLYVTETDQRVYVASVARAGCGKSRLQSDSGRIFWVARDQVVTYGIGTRQNVERASGTAPEMLEELIATRRAEVGAGTQATQSEPTNAPERVPAEVSAAPRPITVAPAVRDQPLIEEIRPATAKPGDKVTVTGRGFGKPPGSVSIGPTAARVESWEVGVVRVKDKRRDRIVFSVPKGATTGSVALSCPSGARRPVLNVGPE